MKTQTKKVPFNIIRLMEKHLSKRGINVPHEKLMDAIMELIARNEKEMLSNIERKKNQNMKLKKWLDNPIETEKTDALKEHDLVV
jgi:hypothetical protein